MILDAGDLHTLHLPLSQTSPYCKQFLYFFVLYYWLARPTLLHKTNIIHSYKFHIPATLWKYLSNPFLPSCEFYSFLLPYICTFYLHGCLRVMVEGVALMYIPSIRFELDFYRILCRIFCFGEILPVVRDFCSLSPVSYTFFLSCCHVMGSNGGKWQLFAYSLGCSE